GLRLLVLVVPLLRLLILIVPGLLVLVLIVPGLLILVLIVPLLRLLVLAVIVPRLLVLIVPRLRLVLVVIVPRLLVLVVPLLLLLLTHELLVWIDRHNEGRAMHVVPRAHEVLLLAAALASRVSVFPSTLACFAMTVTMVFPDVVADVLIHGTKQ